MTETIDHFVFATEEGDTYAIPLDQLEQYKADPDQLTEDIADASDDDVQPYFWWCDPRGWSQQPQARAPQGMSFNRGAYGVVSFNGGRAVASGGANAVAAGGLN